MLIVTFSVRAIPVHRPVSYDGVLCDSRLVRVQWRRTVSLDGTVAQSVLLGHSQFLRVDLPHVDKVTLMFALSEPPNVPYSVPY